MSNYSQQNSTKSFSEKIIKGVFLKHALKE